MPQESREDLIDGTWSFLDEVEMVYMHVHERFPGIFFGRDPVSRSSYGNRSSDNPVILRQNAESFRHVEEEDGCVVLWTKKDGLAGMVPVKGHRR